MQSFDIPPTFPFQIREHDPAQYPLLLLYVQGVTYLGQLKPASYQMGAMRGSAMALPNHLRFYHWFLILGLTQWINESTLYRLGSILDLILTVEEDRVG